LQVAARGYVLVNGRIAAGGRSRALLDDPQIARTYLGWDGGEVADSVPAAQPRLRVVG